MWTCCIRVGSAPWAPLAEQQTRGSNQNFCKCSSFGYSTNTQVSTRPFVRFSLCIYKLFFWATTGLYSNPRTEAWHIPDPAQCGPHSVLTAHAYLFAQENDSISNMNFFTLLGIGFVGHLKKKKSRTYKFQEVQPYWHPLFFSNFHQKICRDLKKKKSQKCMFASCLSSPIFPPAHQYSAPAKGLLIGENWWKPTPCIIFGEKTIYILHELIWSLDPRGSSCSYELLK